MISTDSLVISLSLAYTANIGLKIKFAHTGSSGGSRHSKKKLVVTRAYSDIETPKMMSKRVLMTSNTTYHVFRLVSNVSHQLAGGHPVRNFDYLLTHRSPNLLSFEKFENMCGIVSLRRVERATFHVNPKSICLRNCRPKFQNQIWTYFRKSLPT